MTAFKIGSIYRQRNGEIVRLDPTSKSWGAGNDCCAPVLVGRFLGHCGARRLSDGFSNPYNESRGLAYDLVPGECDEHGNPLEDKKEPFGLSVTSQDKFYDAISRGLGLPTYASASAWSQLNRQIAPRCGARGVLDGVVVYGIEATYIPSGDGSGEVVSKTPTLDKLENEREPQRAPLPGYGQSTPFDNFKGFKVKSNTSEHHSAPFLCASTDLQDESATRHLLVTVRD